MTVYLINILLLTIEAVVLLYPRDSTIRTKRAFVILASLQWILLSGLRDTSVGSDTLEYGNAYNSIASMPWSRLWQSFIDVYFKGAPGKDPGYGLFAKLCNTIFPNYTVYLLIIATIFGVAMGYSIYKNSRDPYISFLLYSTLFYSFFAITGLRQTIATALAVFIGYELIKRKKWFWFLLVVFIASTIHKSSWICLILLPLYYVKLNTRNFLVGIGAIAAAFVFHSPLSAFFKRIGGYDNYGVYEGAKSTTFILMLCAVAAVAFIFHEKLGDVSYSGEGAAHYVVYALAATFFCPLLLVNPSAMRVVQYFSVFLMFLIPEFINMFEDDAKSLAWAGVVAVLVFLFARNNPQYYFIWQHELVESIVVYR